MRDKRNLYWELARSRLFGLSLDADELDELENTPSKRWVARVLPLQNGLVSPFNPVAMGLLTCNQAAWLLGGTAQAKAS